MRLSILRNGDTVYGAIVAGEHLFYVRPPDTAGVPRRRARFVSLWLLRTALDMARLLSYDHGPGTPR